MPISLDMGDGYIKIIYAEKNKNKIKIKNAIYEKIDENYIRNGHILNKIDLTFFLTDLVNKYGFKGKDCFLNISSSDVRRKEALIPKVRKKYLKKIVENIALDSFAEKELKIDYRIVDEKIENKKEFYKIFIYGVPTGIVNDYKSLINNAGLVPKCLDIIQNTIRKTTYFKINGKDINDEIIIFLEAKISSLVISLIEKGVTIYTRNIDISNEVKREERFLNNKNEEKIEKIPEKINEKNVEENVITFLDYEDSENIEETMFISPILIRIDEEIHKIMQFFMSLNNTGSINRAYVYGDRHNMEDIVEYIDQNIIPGAEKIKNISNVVGSEDVDIATFLLAIANTIRK